MGILDPYRSLASDGVMVVKSSRYDDKIQGCLRQKVILHAGHNLQGGVRISGALKNSD